ncbi:MAG: hypothetical protein WC898_03190, partial [Candidatus Paceibacterota bacterium]
PDGKKEAIIIDIEEKLQEFISFYQSRNVNLPPNFEDTIRDIWNRNQGDIEKAIKENGFNDILLIPPTPNIGELSEKMKMENGYYDFINSPNSTVDTLKNIPLTSQNVDKPRIVLVHNTQNLEDRPELAKTLNTKGEDVKLDQTLPLEDYLIFSNKYYEKNKKHLDEANYIWLATKSGARLVLSVWDLDDRRLSVEADDLGYQVSLLGVRPSRCFY